MLFCCRNILRSCPCVHIHVWLYLPRLPLVPFSRLWLFLPSQPRLLPQSHPVCCLPSPHSLCFSLQHTLQPYSLHTSLPPGPETSLLQQQGFQTLMKHLCLRFCLTGIRLYSVSWTSPHFLPTPSLYKDPSFLFHSLPCPTDTSAPPKSVTFVLWFWCSIFSSHCSWFMLMTHITPSSCRVHLTFSLPLLPWSFSFTHKKKKKTAYLACTTQTPGSLLLNFPCTNLQVVPFSSIH